MTTTSPYVDSRVDPNSCTMAHGQPYARVDLIPMPESTLSPNQGLRLWPLKGSQAEIGKNVLGEIVLHVHSVLYTCHTKTILAIWKITKYVHIKSTTVYAPRRNRDSPQPPTRRLVCPLPPVSGGRGTLAGEKGVGRVPIPTRGVHCGTLYMYVLCVEDNTLSYNVHCTMTYHTSRYVSSSQSAIGARGQRKKAVGRRLGGSFKVIQHDLKETGA
jgi:hypothetical protein